MNTSRWHKPNHQHIWKISKSRTHVQEVCVTWNHNLVKSFQTLFTSHSGTHETTANWDLLDLFGEFRRQSTPLPVGSSTGTLNEGEQTGKWTYLVGLVNHLHDVQLDADHVKLIIGRLKDMNLFEKEEANTYSLVIHKHNTSEENCRSRVRWRQTVIRCFCSPYSSSKFNVNLFQWGWCLKKSTYPVWR